MSYICGLANDRTEHMPVYRFSSVISTKYLIATAFDLILKCIRECIRVLYLGMVMEFAHSDVLISKIWQKSNKSLKNVRFHLSHTKF